MGEEHFAEMQAAFADQLGARARLDPILRDDVRARLLEDPERAIETAQDLYDEGRNLASEAVFLAVAESRHPELGAGAWNKVGLLRLLREDREGAVAAFENGVACDHGSGSAQAAMNLGTLRFQDGDLAGAEWAYLDAVRLAGLGEVGEATFNLAQLAVLREDPAGGERWFEAAMASDELECAADAALQLGRLRFERGEVAGAREAWEAAADSGHEEHGPFARRMLDVIREL